MKKIFFSLIIFVLSLLAIRRGYGLFQDTTVVDENKFYSGSFEIKISETDTNQDGIADIGNSLWGDLKTGLWSSPQMWKPGDTVSASVFVRNQGDIDADAVYITLTDRSYYGSQKLDEVVNLVEAWYDRNANGQLDDGEDILPELISAYDTNGGAFTLREFYTGTDLIHGGTLFDLEAGESVLPSLGTDPAVGGVNGTGKGLFMTWQYDPNAPQDFNEAWVKFDLELIGEQPTI